MIVKNNALKRVQISRQIQFEYSHAAKFSLFVIIPIWFDFLAHLCIYLYIVIGQKWIDPSVKLIN